MPELRSFNQNGIGMFRDYLIRVRSEPTLEAPAHLLEDFRYADLVPDGATVEQREFRSKLEFGRYFSIAVANCVSDRTLRTSAGLWAWLSLFYIDQVCPCNGHGHRKVLKSLEKYIPSAGHIATGFDKHLLFFPWKMVAVHGENADWLLGDSLREDNKVVRELAGSYRRNVSPVFVELARLLYFDAHRGRVKRGATTHRPGSLRRLGTVVHQLDLTYDVFGVEAPNLADLLPREEFGRWLP